MNHPSPVRVGDGLVHAWVRAVDGRLVNLSMCSMVGVAQSSNDVWVVSAWSPGEYNQVLGRYDTEQSARRALLQLGDLLDAATLPAGAG